MFVKDVFSQRVLASAGILRSRGILQMRTSAIFGAKTSDFSKFMVYPHG